MIQDYSRRYSSIIGGKQKVRGRKRHPGDSGGGRLWKAIGVIVTLAMVFGVAASLWFGWLVNNGLGELSRARKVRQELVVLNTKLTARRDQLLARERIEVAARRFGLYPPTPKQIRHP